MTSGYDVGYCKPPKTRRFQPGQSGNPKGRLKDSKNFKTDFLEELETKIEVTEGSKKITISKQRALIKRLINGSLNGDPKATAIAISMILNFNNDEEAKNASKPLTSSELELLKNYMIIEGSKDGEF